MNRAEGNPRRWNAGVGIGLLAGIGLVLAGRGLEGGGLASLFQPSAALIVFGGTFGALLVCFSGADLARALMSVRHVFGGRAERGGPTIEAIVAYARRVRRHGMLDLERDLETTEDPFLRKGLTLLVDGVEPAFMRDVLEAEAIAREEDDDLPARVFEAAGGYLPTLGILGAVLGLMHVMENLTDPSRLGAGIAVAFVATVYGVGSANLVFLPLANRLRRTSRGFARRRELIVEGLLAIQKGMPPRLVGEKLQGLWGSDAPGLPDVGDPPPIQTPVKPPAHRSGPAPSVSWTI